MLNTLPPSWARFLSGEMSQPYFKTLMNFIAIERQTHEVYPSESDLFRAFHLTPYPEVRVLLLGQDPYHGEGQANGLSFSVRPGVRIPPSLRNIFKELHDDLGCLPPNHGGLEAWARQGVLLLNTVLTVRAHQAYSHRNQGWETFTDTVIKRVNAKSELVVFVLWGRSAQEKIPLIDTSRHAVVQSVHPSPLSARHGFWGSHPFSAVNRALQTANRDEIDWCLPELDEHE